MESPTTFKMKTETTPKHQKKSSRRSNVKHLQNEFSQYGLHRESSPVGFGCSQDLEIGWGDSPEPLNAEKKLTFDTTPVHHKKKLELKESPRSSAPSRYRKNRGCFSLPQKSPVDLAKYVAQVKELSKNIMKEIGDQDDEPENPPTQTDLSALLPEDDSINEDLIACTQSIEQKLASENNKTPKESSFDKVIQSFMNEEDDWMSSVIIEPKQTPRKGSFVKSRSDNQLESPRVQAKKPISLSQSRTINNNSSNNNNNYKNNFRRTNSFDSPKMNSSLEIKRDVDQIQPLKKQKSFAYSSCNELRPTQYSQKEIEKKRLEAELRKKKKEIERKRLEALKKLEMKKRNSNISVSRQPSCVASK